MILRDQSPLHRHILETVLLDMTVTQWLARLNDRVFFWLHPRRLTTLLQSRPNRASEHDVTTVDTASLVAAHHDQIRLSAINSGATQWPSAPPRGAATFLTIEDYPFAQRRRGRTLDNAVAELAVIGGVPDIAAHVVAVHRQRGQAVTARLLSAGPTPQGSAIPARREPDRSGTASGWYSSSLDFGVALGCFTSVVHAVVADDADAPTTCSLRVCVGRTRLFRRRPGCASRA